MERERERKSEKEREKKREREKERLRDREKKRSFWDIILIHGLPIIHSKD